MAITITAVIDEDYGNKRVFTFPDVHEDITDKSDHAITNIILPEERSEDMGYLRIMGQKRLITFRFKLIDMGTDASDGTAFTPTSNLSDTVRFPDGTVKTKEQMMEWLRFYIFDPSMITQWYLSDEDGKFETPPHHSREVGEPSGIKVVLNNLSFTHLHNKPNVIEGSVEFLAGRNFIV